MGVSTSGSMMRNLYVAKRPSSSRYVISPLHPGNSSSLPSYNLYGSVGRATWVSSRGANAQMQYQDDVIALAEKQEGGWFDGVLEDSLSIFPRPFTRASPQVPHPLAFLIPRYTLTNPYL